MKGTLLQHGRGEVAGNPLTSELDIAMKLQQICGAEGYRTEGGMILALRWDRDGNEIIIDRFAVAAVQG